MMQVAPAGKSVGHAYAGADEGWWVVGCWAGALVKQVQAPPYTFSSYPPLFPAGE